MNNNICNLIRDYITQNLKTNVNIEQKYHTGGYGYANEITIELLLEDKVISSDIIQLRE